MNSFPARGVADLAEGMPHRRRQLGDEAASYIRELIMSGRVAPGDHLRVEPLAAEMQMSATPVREGLLMLRNEGLVVLEANRGFRAAEITRQDVQDIFTAQSLLAGELAARAATTISDDALATLAQVHEQIAAGMATDRRDYLAQLNFEFHRTINVASASRQLALFFGATVRYVPNRFYTAVPGWPDATLSDHGAIIEALERRDPEAARAAMRAHIDHASDLLVRHLAASGLWSEAKQ